MVSCSLGEEIVTLLRELCLGSCSKVFELGSGLGSLTLYLQHASEYVIASEIDPRFLSSLRSVIQRSLTDIVACDGVPLLGALREDVVVVSNTPYVIASRILVALIRSRVRRAVLVLQKDVAEKISAKPGSRSYGRISALVQTFMEVSLGGNYPPEAFTPRPKVWSSVVVLRRIRDWADDYRGYEDFLRCLFNQRRRVVGKRLRECLGVELSSLTKELGAEFLRRRVFEIEPEVLLGLYVRFARS
jgi:16S rRNA (adenine1518-N6/adenine1519-N6)-dimethyltransferase